MKGGKWALTCPNCKLEFVYDEDKVIQKRQELVDALEELKREADKLKMMPVTNGKNEYLRNSMLHVNGRKQRDILHELQKIKALQHTKHTAMDKARTDEFMRIVREEVGDARYRELWEKCDAMFRPESISQTMKRDYTRSSSKANVTNINKI